MAGFEERLYDMWVRRNPKFEVRHEEAVLRKLSDYGRGASELTNAKGKILGGGYEVYILAFFIGLYADKRMKLDEDSKALGHPIMYWGNLDSKKGRQAYPRLREFIFAALVAKTDIDMLEVDKGNVVPSRIVDELVLSMAEFANYGFYVIDEKLKNDSGYFFNQRAFFDMIWQLTSSKASEEETERTEESELEKW